MHVGIQRRHAEFGLERTAVNCCCLQGWCVVVQYGSEVLSKTFALLRVAESDVIAVLNYHNSIITIQQIS